MQFRAEKKFTEEVELKVNASSEGLSKEDKGKREGKPPRESEGTDKGSSIL